MTTNNIHQIVFIDTHVQNWQTLWKGIQDQSTAGLVETILLNPERDGLAQMAEALAGRHGIDAIHLFSHGAPGTLQLGNTLLNNNNLAAYAAQLQTIGQALTDSGDWLLYGCDVAQGDAGQAFITALAQASGADVAASTNVTGATGLGGDWVLEAATGSIEATAVIDAQTQAGFNGVLQLFKGTPGNDMLAGSAGADTLAGGLGDDTYIINAAGDAIVGENAMTGAATSAGGVPATGFCDNVGISTDGKLVVFDSYDNSLLGPGGDANNTRDIFLKNMGTGQVTLISSGANGQTNIGGGSDHPSISANGQYVAFESAATNLLASADANGNKQDVFLKAVGTGALTLVSTGINGQANDWSVLGGDQYEGAVHAISDNGGLVVFTSAATNLIAGAGNVGNVGRSDVFLKDTQTGVLALVSASGNGTVGNSGSWDAAVSGDGHFAVFTSNAINLVSGDSNGYTADIFLKNLSTGAVTLVSSTQNGTQSAGANSEADVSADGRYVVFTNIGPGFGTSSGNSQIYLKDTLTGILKLVSTAEDGTTLANGQCHNATVSNDGRFVMFQTGASNLLPGDTNGYDDIYVKDMLTGHLTRMSLGLDGSENATNNIRPMFSGDGQYAAFTGITAFNAPNTWNGGGIYRVATPINGAAGGIDEAHSSVDFALPDYVENLVLTGNANSHGTGNILDNIITGNSGDNVLDGGEGKDTASYATATAGVTVSLAVSGPQNTFGAGVDTLANIEQLQGSNFGDVLTVGDGGGSLYGGLGDDILFSGAGDDLLDGGLGNDTASYANATGPVTVSLAVSGAQATGSAGVDTLASIENLTGSAFNDQLTGNDGNNILDGGLGADTLSGGNGGDLYSVDNAGDIVNETGTDSYTDTVVASIDYTLTANVEALYLSGSNNINGTGNGLYNTIVGNAGDNVLDGGAGYDFLDGGLGADTMKGGVGNDTFTVDNAGDVVMENFGEGVDTVNAFVDFSLDANIENLNLSGNANLKGVGNGLDNVINGNSGNNTLSGGDGNDWLFGRQGADAMDGGKGDDTYELDDAGDTVTEGFNEGIDTVMASISYTLADNVEKLVLTGTANIDGTGNALANTLTGNAGNNKLVGGANADAMSGGGGDDTYGVDNIGDTVTETAGAGIDTVQSSISYALGNNVENLILTDTTNIDGTGNALANTLVGNAGNNKLVGGANADAMSGGGGDDTYGVDNIGDTVTEAANAGIDTVQSSISYALGNNIENLTLTGKANIDGTGNALANTLVGNAGNNKLDGGAGNDSLNGGAGADTLIGGTGNDNYVVDNIGDIVTEASGQGTDTVQSSISYSLGDNVENLVLIGRYPINGIGNNGTGNALTNTLTGNQAKNALDGGAGNDTLDGGLGSDILTGGTGNDIFRFDSALGATNIDTIKDFVSGNDKLYLDDAVFTQIGAVGHFAAGDARFYASPAVAAHDATDRILYDSNSGALYYDADGNGGAAAVQFAILSNHPVLAATDIWVV